jgi:hypothetical protein
MRQPSAASSPICKRGSQHGNCSVVSGGTSEMAATAVVLPTPKPPAITILTGVGGRRTPAPEGDAWG